MADKTGISWTDATWNPIRGCSRISAGCVNCYAERVAGRFSGPGMPYEGLVKISRTLPVQRRWNGVVRMVPEHLADPLRWRKPRRIFVNSMSDLFHEGLDDEQIDLVFAAMLLAPRHTFQVLTKRAKRMRAYLEDDGLYERVLGAAEHFRRERPELNQIAISNPTTFPAKWIWLGVSVENQAAADERIPELLATPAAVRFLSCEPLIGPVDLDQPLCESANCGPDEWGIADDGATPWCNEHDAERSYGHWLHVDDGIDWVIAGCESGPGARPCEVDWLRSLRDQCIGAEVPFFLKQAQFTPGEYVSAATLAIGADEGSKRKAGGVIELPYLDGKQWAEFPR